MHLGSLYTALASFLDAKSNRGEWLLRIDDADGPRQAAGAADSILRTLERFGLAWDGPVAFQNHALEAYHAALSQLEAAGQLYPCVCSRKKLSDLPRSHGGHAVYPGTCRLAGRDRRQAHALRVVTEGARITFNDRLQGPQSWNLAEEFGDFIVFRRDGIVAYHLATVVDDFAAGITDIVRGFDLLDSTPPQIHLQQLLGLPTPGYGHIPVVVDRHGVKLSKQNLAKPVNPDHPSPVLIGLLELLGQPAPKELAHAPPAEILEWAVSAWDISRLSGSSVSEPETSDGLKPALP